MSVAPCPRCGANSPGLAAALQQEQTDNQRLRNALGQAKLRSQLNIRRAAFTPEIGVRYTEAIRVDISRACWELEQYIDRVLGGDGPETPATVSPPSPPAGTVSG